MRRLFLAAAAATLGLSTVAQAQLRPDAPASTDEDSRLLNITGTKIHGELVGPHGAWMKGPPHTSFTSHISLRTNFTQELKKSIDQL